MIDFENEYELYKEIKNKSVYMFCLKDDCYECDKSGHDFELYNSIKTELFYLIKQTSKFGVDVFKCKNFEEIFYDKNFISWYKKCRNNFNKANDLELEK